MRLVIVTTTPPTGDYDDDDDDDMMIIYNKHGVVFYSHLYQLMIVHLHSFI